MSATSTQVTEALREVVSSFEGDPQRGVALWCRKSADAVVRSEMELCERLGALPLPFPAHVAEVVANRWRPALDAWRAGRRGDALDGWTVGFGSVEAVTGEVVRRLATAELAGPSDRWRDTASRGLQGIWLEAFGLKAAAAAAYFDASRHASEVEAAQKTADPLGKETNDQEPAAIHLLMRTCDLDPEHPLAYWDLADAWRIE